MRLILALVGVALVCVAALTWMNRRTLAREALTGWLRARGVASEAEVEAFGPTIFTARLRIGDPRNPDFAAERAEVRYRTRLTGIEVISVTLRKPVLRASEHNGRLSMGSLDPIVREFLRRPPPPDMKMPRVRIDDGLLVLSTDYGPVRVAGDVLADDGKLDWLAAASAPAHLKGPSFDVAVGPTIVRARRRGDRLDLSAAAPLLDAKMGGAATEGGRVSFTAQLPYPDTKKRRGDGAVVADLRFAARRLDVAGRSLDAPRLSAAFTGQAKGWIPDLAVAGKGSVDLQASGGRFGPATARTVRIAATSEDLRWTRRGGDRLGGTLRLTGDLGELKSGDLRVASFVASATGPVGAARDRLEANLTASAVGRGGWSGLGGPSRDDGAELAALKRAARSFRLAAPELAIRLENETATVALPQPVRLVPDSGGGVRLSARPGAPLFSPAGGAFRLTSGGGGLPTVEADVARYAASADGLTAAGRVRIRGSFGPLRNGEVDAAGRITAAGAALAITLDRCGQVKAAGVQFETDTLEALSGRLCPVGEPLLRGRGGSWRMAARAEAVSAAAPAAQAKVASGSGRVTVEFSRGVLGGQGDFAARLEDTAPQPRFEPLLVSGPIRINSDVVRAEATARPPGGATIATAQLVHDARTGSGGVTLDTGTLQFAEGGLQPAQLSPLVAAVGSPVTGSARFQGRFDWTPAGAQSSGRLAIPRLDFQSPAGAVRGLSGTIAFSSLAPLTAAPGQELTVEQLDSIVPVTNLRASFALADNLLKVAGGEALVGDGRVRVEQLEVPLVPGAATRGVLLFEAVQLHDVVEASPFGDKVELDAKVSGRVPFETTDNRVRIAGGDLKAVQPGRLSIDRAALTGVQADGAVEGPAGAAVDPNDTFTDFAYQAMENLAFDTLDATISSRDDGRLGVLFHVVGRHDPPQKQRIRLSLMDLIQKRFLGKPLPLPSGTGVNLTLDTSLNLDDLLADFAEYQRLHGSASVHPQSSN